MLDLKAVIRADRLKARISNDTVRIDEFAASDLEFGSVRHTVRAGEPNLPLFDIVTLGNLGSTGVLLAFAAGRALDATRFGVAPHDSVTFAGAGVATLIVTAVAVSAGTACARCGT